MAWNGTRYLLPYLSAATDFNFYTRFYKINKKQGGFPVFYFFIFYFLLFYVYSLSFSSTLWERFTTFAANISLQNSIASFTTLVEGWWQRYAQKACAMNAWGISYSAFMYPVSPKSPVRMYLNMMSRSVSVSSRLFTDCINRSCCS